MEYYTANNIIFKTLKWNAYVTMDMKKNYKIAYKIRSQFYC